VGFKAFDLSLAVQHCCLCIVCSKSPFYNLIRCFTNSKPRNATLPSYEYVVVGAGPGGAPLASRLALAGHSVLLIDAGGDHGADLDVLIPATHPVAAESPLIKWDFFVRRYENLTQQVRDSKMSYETPNGEIYTGLYPPANSTPLGILYPRTGNLGGCAQHNALVTMLPQNSDWEYMQALTGDDSWSVASMRKYFKRLEKCEYYTGDASGHGTDGWLSTSVAYPELIYDDKKLLALVKSLTVTSGKNVSASALDTIAGLSDLLELDINNDSPNKDNLNEVYQMPVAVSTPSYSRSSPRDFVWSVANATNPNGSKKYKLDVQLNTLVTKITFNNTGFNNTRKSGKTPRATGVEFLVGQSLYRADPRAANVTGGTPGSVHATKEVIIAGGVFNSPQILKLSGIGPKAELQSLGIDVLVDLPGVGLNMQDRYEIGIVGESDTNFTSYEDCTFLQGDDPCLTQWQSNATLKGGYSSDGIVMSYPHHSTVSNGTQDIWTSGFPFDFQGFFPGWSVQAGETRNVATWVTLKAHSRNNAGTVVLKSTDPRDVPIINFNNFAGPGGDDDLQALYEGMALGIEAFKNYEPLDGGNGFQRIWPHANITSEADLKQFALDEAWGHHACCTTPIGTDSDPLAVLDKDFRVRGVDGLRVVDASAFPKIPGMFIALPIYMISEKAADAILSTHA